MSPGGCARGWFSKLVYNAREMSALCVLHCYLCASVAYCSVVSCTRSYVLTLAIADWY